MALLSLALIAFALAPLPRVALPEPIARYVRSSELTSGAAMLALIILAGLPAHSAVLLAALVVGILGAWRYARESAARRRLRAVLPAVAEQLAAAVRAGLPIPDGLCAIAPGQPSPVAAALRETATLLRLGRPLEAALAPMDGAFGSAALLLRETLRAFHRRGGNVARALERTASLARAEAQLQDEVHALTAQGRASALVLALLAPCGLLFYVVANPGGARHFVADPRGQMLLSVALLLEGVGALWLWYLVRR